MEQLENSRFINRFSYQKIIRKYNFEDGRPGLLSAEISGRMVLIKFWLNRDQDKFEILQDIWLYEVRQLHRLKGCPGVGDYICPIFESSYDEHGFYLVLDSGDRLPLAKEEDKTLTLKKPWIDDLQSIKNRIKLWKNLSRIAKAIQTLHSQGFLHRHLGIDSILTDLRSPEPDFQLTGFEWSIRIQRMNEVKSISAQNQVLKKEKCFSFLSDWAEFGTMIINILRLKEDEFLNILHPMENLINDTGLTLDEINLIRGLIGCVKLDVNIPIEGINANLVLSKIDTLINKLSSSKDHRNESLAISFLFNSSTQAKQRKDGKTSVFNAIQTVFKEMHGVSLTESDTSEFINFVKGDLNSSSYAAALPPKGAEPEDEIILVGTKLVYVIQKSKVGSQSQDGTWDYAFCHSAYLTPPTELKSNHILIKIANEINCFSHNDRSGMTLFQPTSWEPVLEKIKGLNSKTDNDSKSILGFSAYHLAEIAFVKSEIYPVDIISYENDNEDPSIFLVKLKPREEADSEDISRVLKIKSPATRLKKLLTGSQGEYSTWILAASSNLNDDDHEIVLNYLRISEEGGNSIYEFTTNLPRSFNTSWYIIPSSVQGTMRQLSRRASAIDALSEHSELSEALENPHFKFMESHEDTEPHHSFYELDESKQDVFNRILKTLPLYLVQGPPGVGKTFLVTALVQQAFSSEPNSRLLLTAQSHATVFHLFKEVKKALDGNSQEQTKPLIVSCIRDGSTEGESDSLAHLDSLAKDYLIALSQSELFNTSPSDVSKDRIIDLTKPGSRSARGSLMNQLLKSANLVFATTNSRQVEDLIKSRSQFDWTIMEETGKVAGIELLSPLLLSYRRLMIGDHKQLPPYAAEEMRQTLSDLSRLRRAFEISLDVFNNSIKGEFIKSTFTQQFLEKMNDVELKNISQQALRFHLLFENLVKEEEEERRRSEALFGNSNRHKPVASMLSIQHRMHPDIATLIANVFYKGKELKTSQETIEHYQNNKKSFYFDFMEEDLNVFNSASILWIDTPDVQANRGFNRGDSMPQWHNVLETEIVINLLSILKNNDIQKGNPKLALLSPYAKQVERLTVEIENNIGKLGNLKSFDKPNDSTSYCSTVDAFQGSEADIVIVSLVRNNSDSYAMGALGFLLDSRRMNVLLSRAKRQLVIVGSYEFLKHWSKKIKKEEVMKGDRSHEFLVDLIDEVEKNRATGAIRFIKYDKIASNTHRKSFAKNKTKGEV